MDKRKFDFVIVGAGIIGLSTAFELLKVKPKKKVLIIEKENKVSSHQTGQNSGVIHSGIYYRPNSLKAKNCLLGYKLLLEFAKKNKIPFELTGKLIVAITNQQIKSLNKLYDYGIQNGLKNIRILDKDEILKIEPNCRNAIKALYVPQSGIIDYTKVSQKLVELLLKKKATLKLNTRVVEIIENHLNAQILTNNGSYYAKSVILCAGIFSDKFLSKSLQQDYRILPFRGEYFNLKEDHKHLVNGLIYPVPDLNFPFLGVHLTKTISGGVEAGPNAVLALSREGYKKLSFKFRDFVNIITWKGFWIFFIKYWRIGLYEYGRSLSKKKFTNSLKLLVPNISGGKLLRGKCGIRAQIINKNGELLDDFLIDKNKRVINVVNAPSPAATSSFAIAKQIIKLI